MRFTKMEGLGNDYVYVDMREETVLDPPRLARRVSDRRFGIGGDGLILVHPADDADFRMEMYNADGSRGEMCGNGIRCVARFVHDRGWTTKDELVADTDAGRKRLWMVRDGDALTGVRVDMGPPELERSLIPMLGEPGEVIDEPLVLSDRTLQVTAVSMGNPHCVTFVDDTTAYPVGAVGPEVESHARFPNRVNAEFVQIVSRTEVHQRTYERGSGETFACGTGACAVVVAGRLNGLLDESVTVHLLGGDLRIEWAGRGETVFMTGPAVRVFEGTIDVS